MPRLNLTAPFVASATVPGGKDREYWWDAALPGFGLMVTASGARSFVVQYRAGGLSRRATINGGLPLARARREAKIILGAVAKGGDPLAEKRKAREARANTLRSLAEEYLADPKVARLRSVESKRKIFERHIYPSLGPRPLAEIKRSELVRMLERIRRKRGAGASNDAFKVIGPFFNWYAGRDDDFRSPIVRGTYSQAKGEGARTLSDDEIRILWTVTAEGKNAYDHLIRFILVTATRLRESSDMSRLELSVDGLEWTIPEARYKGQDGKSAHAHLIPLSDLARDVLARVPVLTVNGKASDWIFTSNGKVPISGFSKFKVAFDKRLSAALDEEGDDVRKRIVADLNGRYPGKGCEPFDGRWTTHSLRKTARTLLSRAGIDREIAEKCLGHIEGGIVGTYDHHEAKAEKRAAFDALAGEVERIVRGRGAS